MTQRRPEYINHGLIKLTALIQLLLGSAMLVLSGVILFTLPSFIFWTCFLFGFYLFVPGVVISFALIPRKAAQSWARYMIPLWRWFS